MFAFDDEIQHEKLQKDKNSTNENKVFTPYQPITSSRTTGIHTVAFMMNFTLLQTYLSHHNVWTLIH